MDTMTDISAEALLRERRKTVGRFYQRYLASGFPCTLNLAPLFAKVSARLLFPLTVV